MANDVITLYNLALDTIGSRNQISSPTEQSREAEACNLWFPNIRDQVLASAPWPEATKMQRLALLNTQDDDNVWDQGEARPDFLNVFAVPSDLLRPQFIYGFGRFVIQSYGAEQRGIMTSEPNPILVYTFRQTLVGLWGQELQMGVMYALAASICISLTGKTSRAKLLLEQANSSIISARETAANTNNDIQLDSVPDWISARGFSGNYGLGVSGTARFLYPYGSLLTLSNVN